MLMGPGGITFKNWVNGSSRGPTLSQSDVNCSYIQEKVCQFYCHRWLGNSINFFLEFYVQLTYG